jgi:hypothetical protein
VPLFFSRLAVPTTKATREPSGEILGWPTDERPSIKRSAMTVCSGFSAVLSDMLSTVSASAVLSSQDVDDLGRRQVPNVRIW